MQNEETNVATLADAVVATVETQEAPASVETADEQAARIHAAADNVTDAALAPKAKRKPKAKAKPKGEKPAVTATVRDAWGNRAGTSSAAINATLLAANVPLTIAEIHERTGPDGRATVGATRGHVMWLLARGHIKLKDGGYVKAPKAKRKPKAEATGESETGKTAGE